ncbi:hypothetical protein DXV75_14470 [Alteromonas aestuariivivens]|uniref:Phage shock protein B n=1 Tax=Alteromonas aestuariivivens TaxID=1938339 RepID=A0A3D8M445_9ALTE|nr:hypothetical protein [Alteromonas aestuariivivens]RDV24416.1 hypothetical protein DXV75_14470 [Alteromonas aestuariivivens]
MNLTAISIVAIIAWALVSIIGSFRDKNRHKTKDQDRQVLEQQIQQLRSRIEVLEKIVTDDNYELKKQFAELEKDRVA